MNSQELFAVMVERHRQNIPLFKQVEEYSVQSVKMTAEFFRARMQEKNLPTPVDEVLLIEVPLYETPASIERRLKGLEDVAARVTRVIIDSANLKAYIYGRPNP